MKVPHTVGSESMPVTPRSHKCSVSVPDGDPMRRGNRNEPLTHTWNNVAVDEAADLKGRSGLSDQSWQ